MKAIFNRILPPTAATLTLLLTSPFTYAEEVTGDWGGVLAGQLRIVLHISKDGWGQYVGRLESPDQGNFVLEAEGITASATRMSFAIPRIGGSYEATWDSGKKAWAGVWKQGQSIPLVLSRATPSGEWRRPRRPQEEAIAAAEKRYREEDVTFLNAAVTLSGIFSIPSGNGPFPAVVLLSGSGAQSRDEEVAGHKIFLVLADSLVGRGVAVLRYDKRGVGHSTGDFRRATSVDFASDAEAALAFLKTRPEVDRTRIGLIGHSEGGAIAPVVANRNPAVAFVVLLAAPALRTDKLTVLQEALIAKAQGVAEDVIAARRSFGEALYAGILEAATTEEALATARRMVTQAVDAKLLPASAAETTVNRVTSPWFRQALGHDPVPVLRQLKKPVLALFGSLDLQVPSKENLPLMKASLRDNAHATLRDLQGVNHMFQTAITGSPAEYGELEETFAPAALKEIADWVVSR